MQFARSKRATKASIKILPAEDVIIERQKSFDFLISDLHLSPGPLGRLVYFAILAGRARQAESLYILGDF